MRCSRYRWQSSRKLQCIRCLKADCHTEHNTKLYFTTRSLLPLQHWHFICIYWNTWINAQLSTQGNANLVLWRYGADHRTNPRTVVGWPMHCPQQILNLFHFICIFWTSCSWFYFRRSANLWHKSIWNSRARTRHLSQWCLNRLPRGVLEMLFSNGEVAVLHRATIPCYFCFISLYVLPSYRTVQFRQCNFVITGLLCWAVFLSSTCFSSTLPSSTKTPPLACWPCPGEPVWFLPV